VCSFQSIRIILLYFNLKYVQFQDILKNYDFQKDSFDWKFQVSPTELFQEIKKTVEVELFHDSWKRFVRTNAIKSIIQKQLIQYELCWS
jgi:hypothetical protein